MRNPIKIWLEDANSAPDTRYVDTCDGIRAFAILLVGWFHIWQQSWLFPGLNLFGREISFDPIVRSGYIWVDLMILVSGFCLYLPWARLRETGGKAPNALDFYVRRLTRIHPSYLLAVGVMIVVTQALHVYSSQAFAFQDAVTHLTYTHTFFYNSYYASNLGGTLWTMAIEMQFYLLFPLLARLFIRLPMLMFAAMVSTALIFRAYVGASFADISLYFNQLPAYLDTFACGMAAAAIHVRLSKTKHNAFTRVLCTAGSIAVVGMLLSIASAQSGCLDTEAIRMGQMNRRLAMGVLGALLLILSANAGLVFRKIFSNPITRFVSAVSMQFYIWHQTLAVYILQYRIVPSEFENPNYSGDHLWQQRYTFVCFFASFALAALLTYGFERPVGRMLQNRWIMYRKKRADRT